MSNDVLVIGEMKDEKVRNVTLEAINAVKQIKPHSSVVGVLCGIVDLQDQAQEMIYYGADKIYTLTNNLLEHYTSEAFSQAIMPIIEDINPDSIVIGHTSMGKDLAPKLASKLESGLVSDVTEIKTDESKVIYTRPIYSGKAFENKIIKKGIQFVSIRPNNIGVPTRDNSRQGKILTKEPKIESLSTVVKNIIKKSSQSTQIDIAEAKIVVAGGRGLKSAEGFKPLYELAEVLGGAVGATRGACDANYCDYSLQIGQTGKVVTPDLYIAVGISGAIQHLAGMSNSKTIVAINSDPDATIFSIADYGIVGDLFEVIPALIDEIKELKQS